MSMNTELQVLAQFDKYNYRPKSFISQGQFRDFAKLVGQDSAGSDHPSISNDAIQQLWRECSRNSRGEVEVQQLSKIIAKGIKQLKDRIKLLEGRIGAGKKQEQQRKFAVENCAREGKSDLVYRHQRRLEQLEKELNKDQEQLKEAQLDYKALSMPFLYQKPRVSIFTQPQRLKPQPQFQDVYFSDALKDVFWLTGLLILTQSLVSISRPNFINLLAAFYIFSIFILNYVSSWYNRAALAILTICVLTDVMWLVLQSKNFVVFDQFSQYSSQQRLPHVLAALATPLLAIPVKCLLIVRLIPYRNGIKSDKIVAIKILGDVEIRLTGQKGPIHGFLPQSRISDY